MKFKNFKNVKFELKKAQNINDFKKGLLQTKENISG